MNNGNVHSVHPVFGGAPGWRDGVMNRVFGGAAITPAADETEPGPAVPVTILAVTTDPRSANWARWYFSSAPVIQDIDGDPSELIVDGHAGVTREEGVANCVVIDHGSPVLGKTWSLNINLAYEFCDGNVVTNLAQTGTVSAVTTDTLTAASGNWTAPATVGVALAIGIGGGGGGNSDSTHGTGGGGGGGSSVGDYIVSPGAALAYTVGAGGAKGVAGGDTTLSVHVRGPGGKSAISGHVGGLGGSGTVDGQGTSLFDGGDGGTAGSPGDDGAGGGASAGFLADGGDGFSNTDPIRPQEGGDAPFGGGTGGVGGLSGDDGLGGNIPGAGGGGAGTGGNSAAGRDGRLYVSYKANTLGSPGVTQVLQFNATMLTWTFSNFLNSPSLVDCSQLQAHDGTTWRTPSARTASENQLILTYPSGTYTQWRITSASTVPFVGGGTLRTGITGFTG